MNPCERSRYPDYSSNNNSRQNYKTSRGASHRRDNRTETCDYRNQNRQPRRHHPYRPDLDVVALSKYLSFILRHPKKDSRLQMDEEGYIYVKDILKTWKFRNLGLQDVLHIVETNDKQRFAVKQDVYERFMIRATQGHSVEVNLRLEPILDPEHFPKVVHGTTYEAWQFIRCEGLKKMNRAYIHFAIGMPEDSGVISGMRSSSEICIFINLAKALYFGIKFFLSENMVILSQGDQDGRIHPTFFLYAVDRKTRKYVH
ncbi:tRNA 2'-phosphotransferase 1-like [Octopus bimaculoides]|uniref:2'-phosphotransferase n=1 Tax=Octopus bimaculoides TaxID=37653 RepID=A0A0L8GFP2_OCTBM|nr:tRNA 2'-phosphotransferase 1-like [Octopus bimaculoides]